MSTMNPVDRQDAPCDNDADLHQHSTEHVNAKCMHDLGCAHVQTGPTAEQDLPPAPPVFWPFDCGHDPSSLVLSTRGFVRFISSRLVPRTLFKSHPVSSFLSNNVAGCQMLLAAPNHLLSKILQHYYACKSSCKTHTSLCLLINSEHADFHSKCLCLKTCSNCLVICQDSPFGMTLSLP